MDIYRAIRELELEKKRLDGVIASLEAFIAEGVDGNALPSVKPRKPRGRKVMTEQERSAVSERMRKYWDSRRATPGS